MLPVLLCLAATDLRRRWLWLTAAAALLVVTVAAASRAGVALLAGEFFLCAILLAVRGFMSWRQTGLLAIQFSVAATVGILIAGWESLAQRIDPQQMLHDRRFDLNTASLEMARAHLPWGAGYGSWPVIYPEFAGFDDGRYANQAHNDWLQWACEGGAPGLLLMLLFAAVLALPLLRSVWGCGVLFVLAHAVVDYPFHQNAPLAVLIIAVALVAHRDNGRWLSWEASRQYAPSPVSTTFTVLARM
jgi:O-antigen ligase